MDSGRSAGRYYLQDGSWLRAEGSGDQGDMANGSRSDRTGEEKHFGLTRLNPEKPSPTILSGTGRTTTGLMHPYEIRKLTIAEIRALASYPERFQFVGSNRDKWARIGNSVPPLLMRAIAERIRPTMLLADEVKDS